MGNIHINHVIYPTRWPFLNWPNLTYWTWYLHWIVQAHALLLPVNPGKNSITKTQRAQAVLHGVHWASPNKRQWNVINVTPCLGRVGMPTGAISNWNIWQCSSHSIDCHFHMLWNFLIICRPMWSSRIGLSTNRCQSNVVRSVSELWGEKKSHYPCVIGITWVLVMHSQKTTI